MIGGGDGGFGVSFLPGGDQRYQRFEDQQGPLGRAPLQEAVKILSLRVPRVVGANPLAPLSLMSGGGSRELQAGQLAQLMRTLGVGPEVEATKASGAGGAPGPVIGGAPSPYAQTLGMKPTGPGGVYGEGTLPGPPSGVGAPPNIIIGSGGPGGGLLPNGPEAPPSAPAQDDSAALFELARRQREAMGRISY